MRLKRHFGLCILLLIMQASLLFVWQVFIGHSPKVSAVADCGNMRLPRPLNIINGNNVYADCGNERQKQIHIRLTTPTGTYTDGNNGSVVSVHRGDTIKAEFYYTVNGADARPPTESWEGYLIFNGSNNACSSAPNYPGCLSNPQPFTPQTYDHTQPPGQDTPASQYSTGGILQQNHCPSFIDNLQSPFSNGWTDGAGTDITGNHYPYDWKSNAVLWNQSGKVSCGTDGQGVVWPVNVRDGGTHNYSVNYTINPTSDMGQSFTVQAGIVCGHVDGAIPWCPSTYANAGGGDLQYATQPQNITLRVDPRNCQDTNSCGIGGTAHCTPFGPQAAYLGQTIAMPVEFGNDAVATDWHVGQVSNPAQPSDQHSGVQFSPATAPGTPNTAILNENYNSIGGANLNMLRHGKIAAPTINFIESSPGAEGAVTYTFSIKRDTDDAYFNNNTQMCYTTVSWISNVTVDCNTLSLGPGSPSGWYLVNFTDERGAVTSIGAPAGTWNTFDPGVFPGLYPHHTYSVQVFDLFNPAQYLGSGGPFGPCMNASCDASVIPPSGLEPGETGPVQYGVTIYNNTSAGFSQGTYYVLINGVPPAITGGGRADAPFAAGPGGTATNINSAVNITPFYQGNVHATLVFFQTGSIDSYFGLDCNSTYTPMTRPTLKVTNGDISTGGEFGNAANQCSGADADFIAPPDNSPTGQLKGGIRTFASAGPGGSKGSNSDFAAYALGLIQGSPNDPSRYGFYSDAAYNSTRYNALNFSNNPVLGGLLGTKATAFADAHCVVNYFDNTRTTANPTFNAVTDFKINPGLGSGQYYIQPTSPGGTVEIGKGANKLNKGDRVTIYVQGNVYISKDLTYINNWSFDLAKHTNDAPYLMIIAQGNIFIDPSVTQLDGVYIAQGGGGSGIFSTCAPNGVTVTKAQEATTCHNPLIVNGAVIANHVYNVRAANTLFNNSAPSENYNFVPSAIVGSPNLSSEVFLEGLFSQPPVF
jgi:hypothetical protein